MVVYHGNRKYEESEVAEMCVLKAINNVFSSARMSSKDVCWTYHSLESRPLKSGSSLGSDRLLFSGKKDPKRKQRRTLPPPQFVMVGTAQCEQPGMLRTASVLAKRTRELQIGRLSAVKAPDNPN